MPASLSNTSVSNNASTSAPRSRGIPQSTLSLSALAAGCALLAFGTLTQQTGLTAIAIAVVGSVLLLASWFIAPKEIILSGWQQDYIESSPDGMIIMDESSQKVLRVNPAFTKQFGYQPTDLVGRNVSEVEFLVDSKVREDLMEQLLTNHQDGLTQATQLNCKDGSLATMDVYLRHIGLNGKRGLLLQTRDVGERESALNALLDSQQKFARVFEHSPDSIAISRPSDGKILEVNDAFLRISGYSRKEVLGNTYEQLGVFPDAQDIHSGTGQLMKFGSYRNHEITVVRRDGICIPANVSATLFEDDGETLAMTIAKDLRELHHTKVQLEETRNRFAKVVEHSPAGLLIVDENLIIVEANRFATRMLESTGDKIIGQPLNVLAQKGQEHLLADTVAKLAKDGDSTGQLEYPVVNFAGKEVWTQFNIVLQRNTDTGARAYIAQLQDVSEIKAGQRKMVRMAQFDTLTDLPNRSLFTERVDQLIKRAERNEQLAAVLYIDLDQFKRVNDTLGHDVGDQLLRSVAQRLRNCVRRQDTVARLGGDEFAILLENIKTTDAAQRVAEKILETMAQQLAVTNHELVITPSIGVTLFPADATSSGSLLRNADLAMYQAKSRGRNNYQFFARGMNERAITRLQTESELLNALHNGEFEMFYQPKVALNDLSVVGAEALLRWHHPKRGTLTPDKFIAVAEESGAIIEIGRWIIQEACHAAKEFSDYCGRPINIAINISARQFSNAKLVTDIRETIELVGADPNNIELEITETMLMDDVERTTAMLERLQTLGIGIAIDDFGTGYSSFNYLKKFPIQTVKIDRSFVMDIPHSTDDMAISAAIIAMSQRLKMHTVAEGIETREQLAFLQDSGCELGQGYLFAAALPKSELLPLIAPNVSLIGAKHSNLRA